MNPLRCLCAIIAAFVVITPASAQSAFETYQKGLADAKKDRASDNPVGDKELSSKSATEITADLMQEYKETVNRKTVELSKLVMMDNTGGSIYPGALLWAAAVRDGQLHQLEQIPGRPAVTVTFSGMKEIPSGLPADAVITPAAESTSEAARHVSFIHNGLYSDFEEKARPILKQNASPSSRLIGTFVVRESLEDALLSIQLSAKYWIASMSADLRNIREKKRTVALMTLDQVNFSAIADAPPLGGYLPEELVKSNQNVGQRLVSGMASGGEPVYVRKVDYGRRVLISLSAESTKEELNDALKVAVDAASGNFHGEFTQKQKNTFKSVEGKMVIIGGKYPEGVNGFFGGDLSAFVKTVQAIMAKTNVDYDPKEGAVPVSFELAYVADNAPMQVFETAEFAGKIPTRTFEKVVKTPTIRTTGQDAAVTRQDDEIDSDDWTLVQITSQQLRLSDDRRTVYFDLVWQASEGESNKRVGNKTVIRSSKRFSYPMVKEVKTIISQASFGTFQQWYAGEVHSAAPFENCGLLSNIRVKFDAPGSRDHLAQSLEATLTYSVWLEK